MNTFNNIAISGVSGSGKSTLAKLLAERLGMKHFSVGDYFKSLARERGKTIQELMEELGPEIHRMIDEKVRELSEEGGYVFDGRLVPFFAKNALKVFVFAPLRVRAERVAARDGISVEEALKKLEDRDKADRKRYLKIYGIDFMDIFSYHLLVNSEVFSPEELASIVEVAFRG